jgi:preprotein translocase subunit YajC
MFISNAYAAEAAQQPSPWGSLIMLLVFGVIFYFLLIRPQAKRAKEHKEMISSLEKGDEVVTSGGLIGRIVDLNENLVKIKIADNTEVLVQRGMIASVLPKGTIKSLKS